MAGFKEYEDHDAVGLAELVARGEITPEELLEAAIERVDARNQAVNAVTNKLYDQGRQAIAGGLPDGPLKGVPYLLKDLGASLAGCPTTRGCRFFADVVPAEDNELVKRLKRAGMVIFGRTNTCELGLSLTCEPQLHGPTKNPWDLTRISGGSSGGAAAAVGARMLPAAHASGRLRLDPRAGRVLRPRGPEAHARTQHHGALSRRRERRTLHRTRGEPQRARQRRDPGRHARRRGGRPLQRGSAGPPVPGRGRRGPGPAARRLQLPDPERRHRRSGREAGTGGDREPRRGPRTPGGRSGPRHRR